MLAAKVETCRAEGLYRFAVRCDRERALAIGRAAKKAGMTETAFVQAHFDTILEPRAACAPDCAPARAPDCKPDDVALAAAGAPRDGDSLLASDLGIPAYTLRLWRCVSLLAAVGGSFEADNIALGKAAQIDTLTVKGGLLALGNRGHITRETSAVQGRRARWRLNRRQD